MAQHVALKSFGYAPDGINIEYFEAGDQRDFGEATDGLLKEGYIGPVEQMKLPPKDEAPKPAKATVSAAKKA